MAYLKTLNPDAVAKEQANFERAIAPPVPPKPPDVKRINPNVMRMAGEQLAINPSAHQMGIGAANCWIVSRLKDGRLAVGSFGYGDLMTAEEVAEAIKAFQRLPYDRSGSDTVGS